jgi:outer membrane protein assembly factor BamD
MKRWLVLILTLALALASASCKSAKKNSEQKFFDEVGSLSKEAILAKGDQLYGKKRWQEARKYYSFLSDSFPNDPLGRMAALKVADTFFSAKDTESLTEAQLRYKDFTNRFPSDPQRGYALLMLGKCSYQQRRGPMRDLTALREAVDNFKLVLKLYPDSAHAKDARTMLEQSTEDLAEHELQIADFYERLGAYDGARLRLDYLRANFPDSKAVGKAAALEDRMKAKLQASTQVPPATPAPTPGATPSPQGQS